MHLLCAGWYYWDWQQEGGETRKIHYLRAGRQVRTQLLRTYCAQRTTRVLICK